MQNIRKIYDDLIYIGCSDRKITKFEGVYPISSGMAYNSYLLVDEDMCQETDDDEGETAPCIDVLVSHVAHSRNKRTEYLQHSTQCDK